VDDGSTDATPKLIREKCHQDPCYRGLVFSRNFGHQLALSAGLVHAKGTEAVFIIDGDLQDPPELLADFYAHYRQGYDVVYGVRRNRKESWPLKTAYSLFYRFQNRVANIDIPLDAGDFSLLSRRTVDVLCQLPEESRFLRGMRAWIGFRQLGVEYQRDERQKGETKYPFKQLLKLAYNGLFNFSEFPIKLIFWLGLSAISFGVVYIVYVVLKKIIYQTVPEGFTTLIIAIIFFSGVQLFSLGLIGEYIVRIFFQVKNRPLYIVQETISHDTAAASMKPEDATRTLRDN